MASKSLKRPLIGEAVSHKDTMVNGRNFENITQQGKSIPAEQFDNEIARVDEAVETLENSIKDVEAGNISGVSEIENANKFLTTDGMGQISWTTATTDFINDKAVTDPKIALNTIKEKHLDSASISEDKIKDKAVTYNKLADISIHNKHIIDKTIKLEKIEDANATTWDKKIHGSIINTGGNLVRRNGEGGINCTKINISLESNTFDPSKIVVSGDDKTAFVTSKANFINRISSSESNPNTIVKRDENSKIHCHTLNITSESAENYSFNQIPIVDEVKNLHLTTKQNFKNQIGVTELIEQVRILREHLEYDIFQKNFPIGVLYSKPLYNNQTINLSNGSSIIVKWELIQPDRVLMTEKEGTAPSYQGDQWAVSGRTAEVRLSSSQMSYKNSEVKGHSGGTFVMKADSTKLSDQGHSHTLNLHSYHSTWYKRIQ